MTRPTKEQRDLLRKIKAKFAPKTRIEGNYQIIETDGQTIKIPLRFKGKGLSSTSYD